MTIVVSNSVSAILACGGFRDHKGIASALAACAGLTWQTVQGGGTLLASTASVVLDGQAVTLVATPANGTTILVVSASEAAPLTINAGASDNIIGSSSVIITRTLGLTYNSGSHTWSALT